MSQERLRDDVFESIGIFSSPDLYGLGNQLLRNMDPYLFGYDVDVSWQNGLEGFSGFAGHHSWIMRPKVPQMSFSDERWPEAVFGAIVPKEGKKSSADIIRLYPSSSGSFTLFVGDGLSPAGLPNDRLLGLMYELQCERLDGLIPAILKVPEVNVRIRFQLERSAHDFFGILEDNIARFYRQHGINLETIDVAALPAICGACVSVDTSYLSVSRIGDPGLFGVDHTGVVQSILQKENLGVDSLTRSWVSQFILHNPGLSVSEVLRTEDFKRWIVSTYQAKLNQPGGVTVVNGKNLNRRGILSMNIPLDTFQYIILATDGLSLGLNDESKPVKNLLEYVDYPQGMLTYALMRMSTQNSSFREDICVQEKPHDDLAFAGVGYPNIIAGSELGELFGL
jgi:hypothetical protein